MNKESPGGSKNSPLYLFHSVTNKNCQTTVTTKLARVYGLGIANKRECSILGTVLYVLGQAGHSFVSSSNLRR